MELKWGLDNNRGSNLKVFFSWNSLLSMKKAVLEHPASLIELHARNQQLLYENRKELSPLTAGFNRVGNSDLPNPALFCSSEPPSDVTNVLAKTRRCGLGLRR